MTRARGGRDGFTLLEVLVAMMVLGALVVVGLECVSTASNLRVRVTEHAELRWLAERKVAEISGLDGEELRAHSGGREGRFAPPWEQVEWRALVREEPADTGLFQVAVEVIGRGRVFRLATYVSRAEEP